MSARGGGGGGGVTSVSGGGGGGEGRSHIDAGPRQRHISRQHTIALIGKVLHREGTQAV